MRPHHRSTVLAHRGLALAAALGVFALGAQGCAVDVILGFGECSHEGARYYSGDQFAATEGCGTCRCEGNEVICEDVACGCFLQLDGEGGDDQGLMLAPGDSVVAPDGCNVCTCSADGSVVCGEAPCGVCSDPPPPCEAIPDCEALGPLCTPFGWQCDYACGGCDGPIPDCPEPPLGCYFSGPYCDGYEWTCGDLYCDACGSTSPPPCMDPGRPGCTAEPYCDGFAWYCLDVCAPQCDSPPPPCPYLGDGCDPVPSCGPSGWECSYDCAAASSCAWPVPPCVSGDPYCQGQATCLDGAWYCEVACNYP